jgi:hypothetical protein
VVKLNLELLEFLEQRGHGGAGVSCGMTLSVRGEVSLRPRWMTWPCAACS